MKSKRLIIAASLLLLALLLLAGLRPGQRNRGLEALHRAEAHLTAGEYTAAERALHEAARLLPTSPHPHLRLAQLYAAWEHPVSGRLALAEAAARGLQDEERIPLELELLAALEEWEQVEALARDELEEAPEDPALWARLTEAHLRRHRCAAAQESAAIWRDRVPDDPAARWQWALLALHEDESAPEHLCAAHPELCPLLSTCEAPAGCDLLLGQHLLESREWGLAACVLQRALAETPDSAPAHAWTGVALERLGEGETARRHYEQATTLAPKHPLGWLLLGEHRLRREALEAAEKALFEAHRLDPQNPAPVLAMAARFAAEGEYDAAHLWAEATLARAGDDAEIWKAVARFYLERNLQRGEEPLHAAWGAVERAPGDAEAWLLLGWARLGARQPAEALSALEEALARAPTLAEAHYLRGHALRALGNENAAQDAFTRAADLGHTP